MDCLLSVEADVDRSKTSFSRLQSNIRKELNEAVANLRALRNSLDDGNWNSHLIVSTYVFT